MENVYSSLGKLIVMKGVCGWIIGKTEEKGEKLKKNAATLKRRIRFYFICGHFSFTIIKLIILQLIIKYKYLSYKGDKNPMVPFKNSHPKTRKPPNRPYLPQSTSCPNRAPL